MATNIDKETRDSLNMVLQLGYPFGLKRTNHNLWKDDEKQHQQDSIPTLKPTQNAKSKDAGLEAMFESQEQVEGWCKNFPSHVPLCSLMEQRQYLMDNGLFERETTRDKHVASVTALECDTENIQQCLRESDDQETFTKETKEQQTLVSGRYKLSSAVLFPVGNECTSIMV